MPTNFPTSVDTLVNPTPTDSLNAPAHSTQHTNANDAIEAIEGYLLNGGQGLTLVKKQAIGSAVASVEVTDVYSATYDAYKIIIIGGVGSTSNMDLRIINTGSTASYAYGLVYVAYSTGNVAGAASSSAANFAFAGNATTASIRMNLDVLNPFLAKHTMFYGAGLSNTLYGAAGGYHALETSYTGFTITPSAGTLTGGTIYVYGYGKGQ